MASSKLEKLLLLTNRRPDDAELFQRLGKLYRKLGMFDESRIAWEESLRLDPCDPWIHLYLGNWYYVNKDLANAIEMFIRACHLMPDCCISYVCLGDSFEQTGFWDLADRFYKMAAEIDPAWEIAHNNLGAWRTRQEEREKIGST